VEIWDVKEQRRIETLRGHDSEISKVSYSPDGTQLASAAEDGTVRFWDPEPATGRALIPGAVLQHYFWVGHPCFSPDSRSVAVVMENGDVQVVDPTTIGWDVRKVLPKAGFPVAFSGDSTTLLCLGADYRTVARWDAASGTKLSTTPLESAKNEWICSASSVDGSRLALSDGRLIEVYETRTGRRLAAFSSPTPVVNLEFSANGALLGIVGDGAVVLWDLTAGRPVWTATGHRSRITSFRFSPDQKTIATTSWDRTVRLWDAATGRPVVTFTGHKAGVMNCIFAPDGRTLISGCDDRSIRFWNLASLREVAFIPLTYSPYCLAFSPDGQILMANGKGGGLSCWRAPTLAQIDAAEAKALSESKQP
jgi:WD40 repeat protein